MSRVCLHRRCSTTFTLLKGHFLYVAASVVIYLPVSNFSTWHGIGTDSLLQAEGGIKKGFLAR